MNSELQQFLTAHPGINSVQVYLTDPSGVARGKNLHRDELAGLYAHGRTVAGSTYQSSHYWAQCLACTV